MTRRGLSVSLLVGILALCVAACASGSGTSPRSTPTAAPAARRCLAAPEALLAHLSVGARPGHTFVPLRGAAVVAQPGIYVVALRFTGDGHKSQVGLWTTTGLSPTANPMLVADEVASAYTTWGSVQEFPQYGVALDDPALAAARGCLIQ